MVDIKIEKQIPDSAGEGIGKGTEALGAGVGKGIGQGLPSIGVGVEKTGCGIQSFGQGAGYLLACIGDRIKYGDAFQRFPISTQLLLKNNGSTLLEIAKSTSDLVRPETLSDTLKHQEEQNLRKFVRNIVEETLYREDKKIPLPNDFHDTDNLLAIEKAAAEKSDDTLSQMWAKIFVEEATRPDSVSIASIEILKKIDKETATILQEQIFPYCTDDGWFMMTDNASIPNRMIAMDYGVLYDYGIEKKLISKSLHFEKQLCVLDIGEFSIYGHFGYRFYAQYHLTKPALKIKNTLKIFPTIEHISKIGDLINNCRFWHLSDEYTQVKKTEKSDYAIIIDKGKETVLYPSNTYSCVDEYFSKINSNVEEKAAPDD